MCRKKLARKILVISLAAIRSTRPFSDIQGQCFAARFFSAEYQKYVKYVYLCGIVSTFESLVSSGSCITRGRQVAHFRSAETIVPVGGGPRLCAQTGLPSLYTAKEIVCGTERENATQKSTWKETEAKYSYCVSVRAGYSHYSNTTSSLIPSPFS